MKLSSFIKSSLFISLLAFSIGNLHASEPVDRLEGHLVDGSASEVDTQELHSKPYVLFYYSAHWCPPCRKFTPKLVEFYNENGGGEAFEIVFVSSDRSEKDMFNYMEEAEMPWLAVDYDYVSESGLQEYGGPYIPSLVMFDAEGNLIAGTYDFDAEEYLGPASVLQTLSEKL